MTETIPSPTGSPLDDHAVLLAADLAQPSDGPEKVHLGGEYGIDRTVFLRGGYIFNADELGFNAGGGGSTLTLRRAA